MGFIQLDTELTSHHSESFRYGCIDQLLLIFQLIHRRVFGGEYDSYIVITIFLQREQQSLESRKTRHTRFGSSVFVGALSIKSAFAQNSRRRLRPLYRIATATMTNRNTTPAGSDHAPCESRVSKRQNLHQMLCVIHQNSQNG